MSKEKNIVQDLAESDPVISAEGSLVCGHTRPHGGADIRSGATFFCLGSATCLKAVAVDLARGRWRLRIPFHAAHYTQMSRLVAWRSCSPHPL